MSENKVPISATIPRGQREYINQLATKERRSVSVALEILLDEAIEARKARA